MNAIELKGLKKSFPDFTLGPVDLAVPEGTILGLIGENGAGKSTTIKLMLGLLRTDGGSITILGQDAKKLDKNEIGVVLDERRRSGAFSRTFTAIGTTRPGRITCAASSCRRRKSSLNFPKA